MSSCSSRNEERTKPPPLKKLFGRMPMPSPAEMKMMKLAARVGSHLRESKSDLEKLKSDVQTTVEALNQFCAAAMMEVQSASFGTGLALMLKAPTVSTAATTTSPRKSTKDDTQQQIVVTSENFDKIIVLQQQLNAALDDLEQKFRHSKHTEMLPQLPEHRRLVVQAGASASTLLRRARAVHTADCELEWTSKSFRLLGCSSEAQDTARRGGGAGGGAHDRKSCGKTVVDAIVSMVQEHELLLGEVRVSSGPSLVVGSYNNSKEAGAGHGSPSASFVLSPSTTPRQEQQHGSSQTGGRLMSPRKMRQQNLHSESGAATAAASAFGSLVVDPRTMFSSQTPEPTTNYYAQRSAGKSFKLPDVSKKTQAPRFRGTEPQLFRQNPQRVLDNMRQGGPEHYQQTISDTAATLRQRVDNPSNHLRDVVRYLKHDVAVTVGSVGRGLRQEAIDNQRDLVETLQPTSRNTASTLNTSGAYVVPSGTEDHAANRMLQRRMNHSNEMVHDETKSQHNLRLLEKVDRSMNPSTRREEGTETGKMVRNACPLQSTSSA